PEPRCTPSPLEPATATVCRHPAAYRRPLPVPTPLPAPSGGTDAPIGAPAGAPPLQRPPPAALPPRISRALWFPRKKRARGRRRNRTPSVLFKALKTGLPRPVSHLRPIKDPGSPYRVPQTRYDPAIWILVFKSGIRTDNGSL